MSFFRLSLSEHITQQHIEPRVYLWRQQANSEVLWNLFGDGGTKQLGEFFVTDIFIYQQKVYNIVFVPLEPL